MCLPPGILSVSPLVWQKLSKPREKAAVDGAREALNTAAPGMAGEDGPRRAVELSAAAPGRRDPAGHSSPWGKTRPGQCLRVPTHSLLSLRAGRSPVYFSGSLAQCLRTNPTPGDPSQESSWVLPTKPLGSKEFAIPISLLSLDSVEIGSCCSFRLRSSRVRSASLWHTWPLSV